MHPRHEVPIEALVDLFQPITLLNDHFQEGIGLWVLRVGVKKALVVLLRHGIHKVSPDIVTSARPRAQHRHGSAAIHVHVKRISQGVCIKEASCQTQSASRLSPSQPNYSTSSESDGIRRLTVFKCAASPMSSVLPTM